MRATIFCHFDNYERANYLGAALGYGEGEGDLRWFGNAWFIRQADRAAFDAAVAGGGDWRQYLLTGGSAVTDDRLWTRANSALTVPEWDTDGRVDMGAVSAMQSALRLRTMAEIGRLSWNDWRQRVNVVEHDNAREVLTAAGLVVASVPEMP